MKLILILCFLFTSLILTGYHPISESEKDDIDSSLIKFYSSGAIYLKYNDFDILSITIMNDSKDDIYIFWNNFIFQNLIESKYDREVKRQIISNEIILYDTNNADRLLKVTYSDSTINNYPVLMKFPNYENKLKKERYYSFSIPLRIKDLNETVSILKRNEYRYTFKLNYITEQDLKKINTELGMDISRYIICPINTRISNGKPIKNSVEYFECFETAEINYDKNKIQEVLKKYIKHLETDVTIQVFENNPIYSDWRDQE